MFSLPAAYALAVLIPTTVLMWRLYVEEVQKVADRKPPALTLAVNADPEPVTCDHADRQLCTVQRSPGSPVAHWLACTECGRLDHVRIAVAAETSAVRKAA